MTDVSFAMEAKSDQLNAADIIGADRVIKVRAVEVRKGQDQPISVYFDGDNGKPWKPSKGMIRALAYGWTKFSDNWVGKYAQLYYEPTVTWAGKEVGGIRIRAMSDIDHKGITFGLTLSKQKREPYTVQLLKVEESEYPADKFDKALPKMAEMMQSGEMTLQQIISRCQQTGTLSKEQLAALEKAAPVEIQDHDDNEVF